MAEGASQAAEAAGRLGEMVIWGADGESKALEYIEKGKMAGTIYTNCYDQGATAARLAMYFICSEADTSSYTDTPILKMAPIVVTSRGTLPRKQGGSVASCFFLAGLSDKKWFMSCLERRWISGRFRL